MESGVLNIADQLRINRPGIGAPGSAAEIANGTGNGAARDKITSFGQASNGREDATAEARRKPGDQVAEAMKWQGDSIFDRAIVHSELVAATAGKVSRSRVRRPRTLQDNFGVVQVKRTGNVLRLLPDFRPGFISYTMASHMFVAASLSKIWV